jgi:hypothetical protein
MTRRIPLLLALVLGLGALAPLTAPAGAAPPVPTFTTDDDGPEPDAAPGDGVCATAGGQCTLQAAFDEAITLRRGTIVVTGPSVGVTAAVRGSISISGRGQYVDEAALTVERGATLRVGTINLASSTVTVRGRLFLDGTLVLDPARFRVDAPGTTIVRNSFVFLDGAALVNNGRLELAYATVQKAPDPADASRAIQTGTGATTTLMASNLMGIRGNGRACAGTRPVSQGYNLSYEGNCGLSHPTDLGLYHQPTGDLGPQGTPRLDAIPAGEAGCGTTFTTDLLGGARPQDGDGDGVAACDIGYREATAPAA